MKRWQQSIACYLVLCLVLASIAGSSPTWHAWLDHDGGPAHTHLADGKITPAHSHLRSHPQPKELRFEDFLPAPISGDGKRLNRPPATAPQEDASAHTHQSLSQLLLSGAIEGAVILFAPAPAPAEFSFVSAFPQSILIAADQNTQTSERGPPFLLPIL